MSARFEFDTNSLDEFAQLLAENNMRAGTVINEVLHKEGGEKIKNTIQNILPVSDRNKVHAKDSQPFQTENGQMSVTVKTKTKFNYLYFPDDGSNTKKHQGNQQFMYTGAEESSPDILDMITEKIANLLGGE